MSRRLLFTRWFSLLLACGLVSASLGLVQAAELPDVVATVQDQPISGAELEGALRSELLRLEIERYQVMKRKLDELIADQLLQLEATKRGISVEQLEQDAIIAQAAPVTSEQVRAFYEANKSRIRQPLEQIAPRIETYLQSQARQDQRDAFIRELRDQYPVTIALQAPQVDIDADDDPVKGPDEAPVTIIEFSDFQCPYCRRVQPTLNRLMHEYEGKVRLVFRDFPLRNIHPQAQKAAEAAQCAAEQGQFWPYHDKLFAVTSLQIADLKQYAQELGLDRQQFEACLDTGKYADEVEQDLQDGTRAGVNATPSFFVNGRPVSGAVPYDQFKEVIEAALQQQQNAKQHSTP